MDDEWRLFINQYDIVFSFMLVKKSVHEITPKCIVESIFVRKLPRYLCGDFLISWTLCYNFKIFNNNFLEIFSHPNQQSQAMTLVET